MKKLLLLLALSFAVTFAPIPLCAQSYTGLALQNSPGVYARVVPFAPVTVCAVGDTQVPCVQRVAIYSDQTLTTQCSLNANGNGAPLSGATCNNPGLADANGNFTFFAPPTTYRICVYAQNYLCQVVSAGGSGFTAFLQRTNSPNGTLTSQLVTYDCAHIDGNGFCDVQNAALSDRGVIGVCLLNCGTTGIATIGTYLSAPCAMDGGPVTPGDVVSASPTVRGFCNDEGNTVAQSGVQTIGRISKANSGGSGTLAQIDFFLGDLTSPGGSSGSGTVTTCGSSGGSNAYYPGIGNVVSCDPSVTDNGAGVVGLLGLNVNDASHAGYYNVYAGPTPPAAPASAVQHTVPTSVTGYTWVDPGAAGTGCLQAANTSGTVQISFTGVNCGTVGSPPQAGSPVAPTLTPLGTTGSTTITYAAIGCQDGPTCAKHSPPVTATITNANANLASPNPSVKITGYGDTLPGYRCFILCRTATNGTTPNTTGIITGANQCVGKGYIDTGAAGDGTNCASFFAGNTTKLDPDGVYNVMAPCASIPHSPNYGPSSLPCTPNVLDDEAGETAPTPGSANDPIWTWVNQNGTTATYTGGMISLTSSAAADQDSCLSQPLPGSTPYTFTAKIYYGGTATANTLPFLGFRESATGKIVAAGVQTQNSSTSGRLLVDKRTAATAAGTYPITGGTATATNAIWFQAQNDGTNTNYKWSPDGLPNDYITLLSEAKATYFTTGPDQVILCINNQAGTSKLHADLVRRTQ